MVAIVPEELVALGVKRRPVSSSVAPAWVRGAACKRLMIILRAPGCAYDLRPGGGCRYCGFRRLTTQGTPVASEDIVDQFNWAIEHHDFVGDNISELDLFNSGSFFNDLEIPADARLRIFKGAAQISGLKVMLVESRPEYITRSSLFSAQQALDGNVDLDVAIGLDAYDDHLREQVLRKGYTKQAFELAVARLAEAGAGLLCYVMLKPWTLSDEEALRDAVLCAHYARSVAERYGAACRIALEPTFVVPGTPLAEQYGKGAYRPPSLWLVRQAAEQIASFGSTGVGLWDEDLQPIAVPSACPKCQPRLLKALQGFNSTQDRSFLQLEPCECVE